MFKVLPKLDYKNIFGLTFLVGTIFIILGSWFKYYISIGTVLPILCMLAYSSLGFVEDKDETLLEQFADSIYYLGFLLTLVALIVSLVFLSEQKDNSLVGVGSRFGVALATTVLGLFLRILLTNFRESISDQKVFMEKQLAKSMKDFSYQVQIHASTLRTTTDLYKSSVEYSVNSMNKSIQTLTSGLDSISTKGLEHVATTFERTNEQLSLGVKNLFEKIELIQVSEDILTSPIQEPIKNLALLLNQYKDGFASVTEEQKQISQDNKLFAVNLKQLNQSATKLDNSIQKISETLTSIKNLDTYTQDLNQTIEKTVLSVEGLCSTLSKVSNIEPRIQNVIESIDDIDKVSQKLKETIENHEMVVTNIDDISNSHLDMIKNHQSEIEKIMEKSRENLNLLNENLIKSVQFITDELGRGSGDGS